MNLALLTPQARALLSEEFRKGYAELDFTKYRKAFSRDLDLTPFVNILGKAMAKFGDRPEDSDAWLAPRVHATLRLSRREAADPRVWSFLAVVAVPHYVRWRWKSLAPERFVGPEYKHALARLWWGAELTRNGHDYACTKILFAKQDLQNSWARLDLFHHRPAVIASLRFLSTFKDGGMAGGDQIRQFVKGLNMMLTTTMLDAVAPDPPADADAVKSWCLEQVDETRYYDNDPKGPPEAPVPEDSIKSVTSVLDRVADVTTFFKRDRKAGTQESTEPVAV